MQFKNRSVVNGYDDLNIDFKENLEVRDSITFKNCNNLKIRINSKVNKLIFKNCNIAQLECSSTISGIDIEKCKEFKLIPSFPYTLGQIEIFKSDVDIIVNDEFDSSKTHLSHYESNIKLKKKEN